MSHKPNQAKLKRAFITMLSLFNYEAKRHSADMRFCFVVDRDSGDTIIYIKDKSASEQSIELLKKFFNKGGEE